MTIDVELPIDFADCGPWRSYHLYSTGESYSELYKEATISEIDQDGGDLNCYGIDDAPNNEIFTKAIETLQRMIEENLK